MTEIVTNPYDVDEFDEGGGGLWADKVVQITSAAFIMEPRTNQDGSPAISTYGKNKGNQIIDRALKLTGLAVDDEKERWQTYSTGAFEPTEGGEQCAHPQDPSKRLNKKAKAAVFFGHLANAGFDTSTLFPKISVLVGQRFLFSAVNRLDPDGNTIKNDAGYLKVDYFPTALAAGGAAVGAVAVAQAEAGTVGNGLAELADETILKVLTEAEDGKLTRTALVKAVSKALAGNADSNKVVALVVRQDFHTDKPWTYSGTGISL